MPKLAKSDVRTHPEPRGLTESPRGEPSQAAEGGARLLIVCFIAVVAIAALLLDRSTTIATSDSDTAVSKSASTAGFAGQSETASRTSIARM
jgi:hypothetical protein